MAIDAARTTRSVSFVFVVLGLVGIAAGQAAMLVVTTQGAQRISHEPTQRLLLRLAWLSLVLLCLTLLMLLWAVIRHLRYRLRAEPPVKPSRYVNAWALAGKRFQLDDEDEQTDDD